ncbi:UNVERIFIED_CONTAM: hypothetical protein Sangu_1004300 [Sesamum angustifolium]|uniref:RNase H type-1 domain-containing protein n=1 Tax=Sesamum angustifolium TaxID=2727405 RepID=A0AAW2PDN8_9LAMI
MVLTNHLLKRVLAEPNISGKMVKWAVELSEYGIEYRPRPAIEAQALVNFVIEMTDEEGEHKQQRWKLFIDGSSTLQGSEAAVTLETPQGEKNQYALRFNFNASNNEAEYEALLAGAKLAQAAGAKYLRAYSDSQLVLNQVRGDYEAKGEKMVQYLNLIRTLCQKFENFELQCVPQSNNKEANQLAKLASSLKAVKGRKIILSKQEYSEIEEAAKEVLVSTSKPCWKDVIEAYLTTGSLPLDKRKPDQYIRKQPFHHDMRKVIQKGFLTTILEVSRPRKSEAHLKGSPRRKLRESLRGEITSRQDLAARLLPAIHSKRRLEYGEALQKIFDSVRSSKRPFVFLLHQTFISYRKNHSPFHKSHGEKSIGDRD